MASLVELHNEVRWAIESGDLAQARARCERILAELPDNVQTQLLLAEVALEERKYRTACAGFERVLHSDPEAYLGYAGLGIAYDQLKNSKGAIRWYSRALDLDPANAAIREERNRLFGQVYPGRLPPTGLTRFALGRQLFQSGFREEGIARLRSAVERHPERTEIRLALAEGLWAIGKSAASRELCAEILLAEPQVVKANALLACIAAESGDYARSQDLLAEIGRQDPEGYIAGYIIAQSPLAELASPGVDLPLQLEVPEAQAPPAEPDSGPTPWVRWMRQALWSALRLIKPAVDEVAASRAAWARIVPHLAGDDTGTDPGGSPAPTQRPVEDPGDHTEVIYPGAARRRRRSGDQK